MLVRDIIDTAACARVTVREISDGRQALDYLRRAGESADIPRPDLIYLDVEMPGLSGHDVLRALRADPRLRDIPVVMLTGVEDAAARQSALQTGARAYLVKPAEPARFFHTVTWSVRRWVGRAESAPYREAGSEGRLGGGSR